MFLNILHYIVSTVVYADVMSKTTLQRIPFTILVLVMMVLCEIFYFNIYSSHYVDYIIGLSIFTATLMFTLFSFGIFSRSKLIKTRTQELVRILIGVIEAGDANLDGHSLYVTELSMLIYENLPLRKKIFLNADSLKYASLLFDVGKLGVPRSIIDKKGKLETSEWEFIRRHPIIGSMILQDIPSFEQVGKWIQYHHERVDGSGYYKLKGAEIPLASRIIAVADTYSAITMNRNYKSSKSYQEALTELNLSKGSQLDSNLVDLFNKIPEEKVEKCLNEVRLRMEKYGKENFR